jgi:hypothetical protein
MFKKAILSVAIALVLAVAGVTVAAASSAGASKHRPETIQLVAKQTQATVLVHAAAGHGPVGNELLTTDDVFRQGRRVGDNASVCQIMAEPGQASLRVQCVATVSLPEGQLTVQGLATVPETGSQPFTLAITGGTGAYRTAQGQVQIGPVSETERHDTLTLILWPMTTCRRPKPKGDAGCASPLASASPSSHPAQHQADRSQPSPRRHDSHNAARPASRGRRPDRQRMPCGGCARLAAMCRPAMLVLA